MDSHSWGGTSSISYEKESVQLCGTKTCTLGFLLLHRCFKIMLHKQKVALSDLHEAAMKQHEALHIQGEQKLQSRIIGEAAVKQQFFSNAASSLLHANPRVQVFPSLSMTMKQL